MQATTVTTTAEPQSCPGPPRPARDERQRAFITLDTELTSARRARGWTGEILAAWQLVDLADDAEAVVAELVANAAVHASARPCVPVIGLELAFGDGMLAICVSDGSPVLPRARCPAADAVSGRGLLMVEALSDRHGWHPSEDGVGKVVWAVLKARRASLVTDAPPAASAGPGTGQPGVRRGPLITPDRSGRTTADSARPVQQPAAGPGPALSAAGAR
jgi:anti-sigma regulatory factor (Ser/Thr protein kinase)